MPLATASQAVMPPKTLTNTLFTAGSDRMMCSPLAMTSAEAPPPMSRKLAGRHPAELLTGVGDDVEGAHDQAGAVADDADLALELDVVEVLLLGRGLERVGRGGVLQRRAVLVPEGRVVVEGDLRVERQHGAVGRLGQGVDLDQGGVLGVEGLPQLAGRSRSPGRAPRQGSCAASTISVALASSTPVRASIGMRASASGLVTAISSISMPPSTEAIARKVRLARSSR